MFLYQQSRSLSKRFRLVLLSFLQRPDLPFADVLSEQAIETAFDDEDTTFAEDQDAVFTPAVTLWAFLSQVLFKDEHRSCVAAVARVAVLLVALKRGPCSSNTGAYCRARGKLSEKVIRQITIGVGAGCEDKLGRERLWHGRHVRLVDGSTVGMPDTPENQEAYPQNSQQKEGLGFPIARVVVLLSLATGMITDMAMGPYAGKETGESALLRSLFGCFDPGDVLLADRYYCSYFMIALLQERGIDLVARLHQRRPVDFRRGRPLGKDDQVVTWNRPQRPAWMDQSTYDRMPASIEVRQTCVHVGRPGFRVESFVTVTTLTDAKEHPKEDIADLYNCRWQAELDIRAIKITMGMDILRCFGAGDGSQGDVDVPAGLQPDSPDHAAIGAGGGGIASHVEFHRRPANDWCKLAGHGLERRHVDRTTHRHRLGDHGPAHRGQPTGASGTARDQTQTQGTCPTHQATRRSAGRTTEGEIDVSPYYISGSAIRNRPSLLLC